MLFNSTILINLVSLKKHLLRLVEIELFVQFSPPFANTFSVVGNFITKITLEKNNVENRTSFLRGNCSILD
ncbi:hypothetical protein D1003_10955 [Riemerella anatipestifer]|nr:hypothetical protein [Riemerella anatipestifer]